MIYRYFNAAHRASPPGPRPPLWGLARGGGLDPSRPTIVTHHVATLNHARVGAEI